MTLIDFLLIFPVLFLGKIPDGEILNPRMLPYLHLPDMKVQLIVGLEYKDGDRLRLFYFGEYLRFSNFPFEIPSENC